MKNLPPLNGLRAFEAAGRHLTFQAAAQELDVTQGAVAQQVRALEAQLGVQLFDRHSKGLTFTAAGRGYHAQIQTAFAMLREATETLLPEADKVLVSVTPTFASKWLIPNLPDFSERHPDIDLRIVATEKVSSFHSDGIDLAVRQGNPPFGASLDAHLLFKQEIIAVAAPQLVQQISPDTNMLASLPRIHDAHSLWPKFLGNTPSKHDALHGLQLSQTALAIDAAISGQGVALASRFLVGKEIDAGNLVQVVPEVMTGDSDFYLLVRRDTRKRPAVAAVIEWMKQASAPHGQHPRPT